MWKRSLYLVAFLAVVLSASGCGGGPSDIEARQNEESSLFMGQRALIVRENLEISFEDVIEDSRCPRDVICVWAGRVTCMVELTHAGSSYRMALTEPGLTDEYYRERYEEYELTFHVTPYPEAGKKIPMDEYRLHLTVSKLSEPTKIIGSIIGEPFALKDGR
jgi:hypothetical protein